MRWAFQCWLMRSSFAVVLYWHPSAFTSFPLFLPLILIYTLTSVNSFARVSCVILEPAKLEWVLYCLFKPVACTAGCVMLNFSLRLSQSLSVISLWNEGSVLMWLDSLTAMTLINASFWRLSYFTDASKTEGHMTATYFMHGTRCRCCGAGHHTYIACNDVNIRNNRFF